MPSPAASSGRHRRGKDQAALGQLLPSPQPVVVAIQIHHEQTGALPGRYADIRQGFPPPPVVDLIVVGAGPVTPPDQGMLGDLFAVGAVLAGAQSGAVVPRGDREYRPAPLGVGQGRLQGPGPVPGGQIGPRHPTRSGLVRHRGQLTLARS